ILTVAFNPAGETGTPAAGSDDPATVNVTVNVSLATQDTLTITSPGTKTYGDSAFPLSVSGGSGTGTVTYELDTSTVPAANQAGTVTTAGQVTITGSGNIYVRATKAADANYSAVTSATLTISVGKKDVITVAGDVAYDGKVYDGTTSVTGLSITAPSGIIGSDIVSVAYDTAVYDEANVGSRSVTVSGLTLEGMDAGKYNLTNSNVTKTSVTITAAPLSITANNKVITVNGSEPTYTYTVSGLVNNETEAIITTKPTFVLDKAFNSSAADTFTITPSGAVAANYVITYHNGTLMVVDAILLNVIGLSAQNKIYDGTNTATFTGTAALSGNIGSGDDVSLSGTATGTFVNANVENTKSVTMAGLYLTGNDAAKYHLVLPNLTANITPASLSITGFDITKPYDGTNEVKGFGTLSFTGLANNETADVAAAGVTAYYDDKNTGAGKAITFNHNFTMSGGTANATNYTITQPTGITGTITKANQNAPAPPTEASKTATSITLNTIAGAEYRISTGTWQDSPIFSFLNPNTGYTFFARLKGTDNHNTSPESAASAVITTDDGKFAQHAPAAFNLNFAVHTANISYTVTIPLTTGAEYSFDGVNFDETNTLSGILPGAIVTGYKRMKETITHDASDITSASLTLPAFSTPTPTPAPGGGSAGDSGTSDTPAAVSPSPSAAPSPAPTVTQLPTPAPRPGGGVTTTLPDGNQTGDTTGTASAETIPANAGAVAVEFTRSGGSVTLDLSDERVIEIINSANEGTAHFDLSSIRDATTAVLPGNALSLLTDAELSLELKLPQGTLFLDSEALKSAVGQADGTDITATLNQLKVSDIPVSQRQNVRGSDLIFSITLSSGSQKITHFDGELIAITVPYDGKIPVFVWYLRDDGELELVESTYNEVTKTVTFYTNHLSLYVVGPDESIADEMTPDSSDSGTGIVNPASVANALVTESGNFSGWPLVGLGLGVLVVAIVGVIVMRKKREE
ncbi:MAG: YDG domain-containing protein, partial [Lachnospiraceae bacterium]|nr:YDG domain-containing protein [Lachnospiraceae bacterium]